MTDTRPRKADRRRPPAFALLTYVVTVTGFLLYWNAVGGMLKGWKPEDETGQFRDVEGRAFGEVVLLWGSWVCPFSLVAAVLFVRMALLEETRARKVAYGICAVAALVSVFPLFQLRFFEAALAD